MSGVALSLFGPQQLARVPAPRAAIIGAGVQGYSHLEVLAHVLPGVELVIHDRHQERAEALAETARSTPGIVAASTVDSARDAVADADAVGQAAGTGWPAEKIETWASSGSITPKTFWSASVWAHDPQLSK